MKQNNRKQKQERTMVGTEVVKVLALEENQINRFF